MGKRIKVYEMLTGAWTHDGEEHAEIFEGEGARSKATLSAMKVAGKDDTVTVDYTTEQKRTMARLGLDPKRMLPKAPKKETIGEWEGR